MSKTELLVVRTVAPGINDPPRQKRLKNETKQILCQSSDVSSKARRHFRDWLCTYFDQEKKYKDNEKDILLMYRQRHFTDWLSSMYQVRILGNIIIRLSNWTIAQYSLKAWQYCFPCTKTFKVSVDISKFNPTCRRRALCDIHDWQKVELKKGGSDKRE